MNLVIEIYIIICALLLVFDIVFLFVKNINTNKVYRINMSFADWIREETAYHRSQGAFSEKFAEALQSKLSKTKNMITLQNVIGEDKEAWEWFRNAVLSQLDTYKKKSDYEQAYYTYLISTFDYREQKNPPEFNSEFMTFLNSKSLYIFTNTMVALYEIGETELLIQAMDEINERGAFYHKKLLVDGLLASKANFDELNPRLVACFDRYTPYMQDCLLDYFRLNGYNVSDLCIKLLEEQETEKQVQYTAMRYFAKYPDERAKRIFLQMLTSEEEMWVYQMLAIQALINYSDFEVWQAVGAKITSPNWFVRINAVDYMYRIGLSREQVFEILYMRDRYANEALLYQYRDDKHMSRYIIDTIQLLSWQSEMSACSTEDIELVVS